MKIALIGPTPPPQGGIATHIYRLERRLAADGHNVAVYGNCSSLKWILAAFGRWWRFDIAHFHDIDWGKCVLVGLFGILGIPAMLTIHGDSLTSQVANSSKVKNRIYGFFLKKIRHIFCVKEAIVKDLVAIGVNPAHISVLNAFLPPASEEIETTRISPEQRQFMEMHNKNIVLNASRIMPVSETEDLYGISLSIELCRRLSESYPGLGFCCNLAVPVDESRFEFLQTQIRDMGMSEVYRFFVGKPFVPVLAQADLLLRPTYEDGYAVSVAEAMFLGIPVVASDMVPRGEGVELFRTGNIENLEAKVRFVLEHYEEYKERRIRRNFWESYEGLLAEYSLLVARKAGKTS
ncbi:MAG: glycosyltransferase [Anaerolineales bacterium]|nr:glycosyltransferase [Anaerolineales bacterium]